MTNLAPFAEIQYELGSCNLRSFHDEAEAARLGEQLANMDPWRTLCYTASAMRSYLLRQDTALYRYVIVAQNHASGVVCVRYPWLRGSYLELIGLDAAAQGHGVGADIMDWLEAQTRLASRNVWLLVSSFNTKARAFYERRGYHEIGPIEDFIEPGYDEILLRKVV